MTWKSSGLSFVESSCCKSGLYPYIFLLQTHVHIVLPLVDCVKVCVFLASGPTRGNGFFFFFLRAISCVELELLLLLDTLMRRGGTL